jgi:hypothetical protein
MPKGTSFAVLAEEGIATAGLVSALKAAGAGAGVVVEHDPAVGIAKVHEQPIALFTTVRLLEETLDTMGKDRWRVFVLSKATDETTLQRTLTDPRVGGVLAWDRGGRPWELRYLARRLLAPNETPPRMGELLGWGATTMAFRPSTTAEERETVIRVEKLARRLGAQRREAETVSTAAHELLMNAIYDAPIDGQGQLKYALHRAADIQLLPAEIPTLVFTISADFVALDMLDPFGRLPRNRFYEGVLRGHRNLIHGRSDLDTSMGGAGLGLHTLYSSGSILRAELQPNRLTHVSWVLDRRVGAAERRTQPRSLYFLPYLPKRRS